MTFTSRRVIRAALAVTGVALAGFHVWLFAAQVAAGRLEDPWLIFRWLAAATLVAALTAVRRHGDSIWGRKGIAIWVLAALLHGPAVAGADPAVFAIPEVVETWVLRVVTSAALAIGLWLLASFLAARRPAARSLYAFVPAFSTAGRRSAGRSPQISPRPPPLRR